MENKLLKELYDHFYVRPELDEQENEVEECHKALIAALEKPERKLVLRIIDAQDSIREQTSLDSFIAGFGVGVEALGGSTQRRKRALVLLSNQESGRSFYRRTGTVGAAWAALERVPRYSACRLGF